MPNHHPDDDILFAYAAGSQEEPLSLLVATHLALCPGCRSDVERLEEVGGIVFDTQESQALSSGSVDRILARLDDVEAQVPVNKDYKSSLPTDNQIPLPLRDYLGGEMKGLNWKSYRNLEEAVLLSDIPDIRTRMMRIRAGAAMPTHTHSGTELTLVLSGGFSDDAGHYLRGDVSTADASVVHRPIADMGEDCICLAVSEGSLRLTGPVGRWLNPFVRI